MINEIMAILPGALEARETLRDKLQQEEQRPGMHIEGGVAIIPVKGLLGRNLEPWEYYYGATSYDEIEDELRVANNTEGVTQILLEIDSPGGYIKGLEELVAIIQGSSIPTAAFVNDTATSAAYDLAAATDLIIAYPSSDVGSIGVRMGVIYDSSQALADQGIKVHQIASGEFKAIGEDGSTPVSEEQLAYLQGHVDDVANAFRERVSASRPRIAMDDMQGQVFDGLTGLQKGFVDVTIQSRHEIGQVLRHYSNHRASRS